MSKAQVDEYARRVQAEAAQAEAKIREYAQGLEWGRGGWDATGESLKRSADAQRKLTDYAYRVITAYGEDAATIACDFYDEMARAAGEDAVEAVIAESPTVEAVAGSVSWAVDRARRANGGAYEADAVAGSVAQMAAGRTRRAANLTTSGSAAHDHVRYGRVTTSARPCAFCLMLASSGFVYRSERTALLTHYMDKYHDDCKCVAVADFTGEGVEGYRDTERLYYRMYKDAADSVPDDETAKAWQRMSEQEQDAWRRPDHPGWSGYANYRTHQVLSALRKAQGVR